MSQATHCLECGAELPTGSLQGLCPKCLLAAGLESRDDEGRSAGSGPEAPTTPHSGSFVPPEPAALAAHFPQLEIIGLLGHGGMGSVYKARQPRLDRLVALKVIRPESADTPAFAERFNREARTLARLSHPQIVAVYDFGEVNIPDAAAGGQPRAVYYFIMEYVDGANLRQLMRAGELMPQQALVIVPQICDALEFAHNEGVVHRDIKPENILLDKRGRVKIADFGLAKLAAGSTDEFTLTGTHQVMGTPRYMAPEQMEGSHAVDHRADIYSLGVVFYEMLTGEVPMGHFEPPSKKVEIDVRLDEVVLRALAREPERRYQHASEVKSEVESISKRAPSATIPVPHGQPAEDDARIEAARQLVQVPALGLIGIGILMLALGIFVAVVTSTGAYQTPLGPLERWHIWLPIIALTTLPIVIIIGGVNMLRLTSYGWVVGASVLALSPIPAGPFWLLGLPLGIWSLVVLTKPEVTRGFTLRKQRFDDKPETPQRGGRDWVTLTREQIDNDRLPDCCIVCGRHTLERVNKDFWYQPDWAGLLTLVGCLFFLIPGVIIASLTTQRIRVACPICPTHRDAWRRLIWIASTGWLAVPVLGLIGFGVAYPLVDLKSPAVLVAPVLGILIGLVAYLVPVIQLWRQTVGVEWMTSEYVRFCRVSAAFAREAAGMSGAPQSDSAIPGQHPRSPSTIRTAWDAWWAERDQWFTKCVLAVLVLVSMFCLWRFLGFSQENTFLPANEDGEHLQETTVVLGLHASPYCRMVAGPAGSRIVFLWNPWSWAIMMLGLLAWHALWQIKKTQAKATGKELRWWHGSPGFIITICLVLVVLEISWGIFLLNECIEINHRERIEQLEKSFSKHGDQMEKNKSNSNPGTIDIENDRGAQTRPTWFPRPAVAYLF